MYIYIVPCGMTGAGNTYTYLLYVIIVYSMYIILLYIIFIEINLYIIIYQTTREAIGNKKNYSHVQLFRVPYANPRHPILCKI